MKRLRSRMLLCHGRYGSKPGSVIDRLMGAGRKRVSVVVPVSYVSGFTLDEFRRILQELMYGKLARSRLEMRRDFMMRLPACGYESYSDEEFMDMVRVAGDAGMVFFGGSKGVGEFRARCQRLGLLPPDDEFSLTHKINEDGNQESGQGGAQESC